MLQRIIWGAVYGTVMIGALWLNQPHLLYPLLLAISILCLNEYFDLASITHPELAPMKMWYKAITLLAVVGFFTWAYFSKAEIVSPVYFFWIVPLTLLFLFISELFFPKQTHSMQGISISVFGMYYAVCGPLLALAVSLPSPFGTGGWQINSHPVLFVLALIWTCDTMQYFSGKALGRHKLFERVSPNKTIEGAIGGIICTMGAAYLFSLFQKDWTTLQWIILGGVIAIFSILGDLVESLLKRQAGVKDSGVFMPGHGGALDRFDSFLIVMPVVYLYLWWFVK